MGRVRGVKSLVWRSLLYYNIDSIGHHIYIFQVDTSTLVCEVKERIRSDIKIPLNLQRLVYRGRTMNGRIICYEQRLNFLICHLSSCTYFYLAVHLCGLSHNQTGKCTEK